MSATLRLAWTALVVNVGVIAMGVVVRATESGAGCGRSWPTCQGTLLPAELSGATVIEFTHRTTSGLAMILTFALFVSAARLEGRSVIAFLTAMRGSILARATAWAVVTVTFSALIGAAIVLFEWVADDSSIARLVTVPLHLVNTFALLAALAVAVAALRRGASANRPLVIRLKGRDRLVIRLALGSMIVVAAAGAVTALADTLFPSESLGAGLAADFSATATWLTRVRIAHPAIAVVVAILLVRVVTSGRLPEPVRNGRWARAVVWLVAAQVTAGVVNVVLLTPVWMQIVHIVLADSLWVALVWFAVDLGTGQIRATSSPSVSTGTAHTMSSQT